MDVETAKGLKQGQEVYHVESNNADGTPKRYKVTSVKTWKRDQNRVEIGLKRGLYEFHKINECQLALITDKEPK